MSEKFSKSKLNLVIDIIMMIVMMGIAGIGLMMKYVLVAGYKATELYGKHVDLTFLNLNRHEWGSIHLWLSYSLLFLLLLHLIFHWKLIVAIWKRLVLSKQVRWILAVSMTLICVILLLGPLLIKPNVDEKGHESGHEMHQHEDFEVLKDEEQLSVKDSSVNLTIEEHEHGESRGSVSGSMTLREVSEKNELPLNVFLKHFNIPEDEADVRLGQLKRRYNFEMQDVRLLIDKSKKH